MTTSSKSSITVHCPTCGQPVAWTPEARWRPFCSERCRLIDLGLWANEQHRVIGDDAVPIEEMND